MANSTFSMPLTGLVVAAIALMGSGAAAAADHACDPVDPVMENGWTVVPSDETVTTTAPLFCKLISARPL